MELSRRIKCIRTVRAFAFGETTVKIRKTSNSLGLLGESEATLSLSPGDSFRLGGNDSEDKKKLQQPRLLEESDATLSFFPKRQHVPWGFDSEDKKKLRQPGLFRGILSNTEYFVRSYQKQRTAQKQPRKIVYYSDIVYCINHDYNSLIRRAGICMKNGFRSFAKN